MTTGSRTTNRARREARPRRSDRATAGTTTDRITRLAIATLGSALLVCGLRRRSIRGTATALAGGWLLSRALRSRSPFGDRSDDGGRTADAEAVSRSIVVGKPSEELYEAWRDPDLFSRVVGHVADVTPMDGDRFRWTVHGPRGRDVSWETRVVAEEPGAHLRWETSPDAPVSIDGSVRFRPAPGDRGTIVTLSVAVEPPGGPLGRAALRRLDLVPETLAGTALGRFKSLVEAGEIPTLEGNPSARGRGDRL